jgi:hypothetical protein
MITRNATGSRHGEVQLVEPQLIPHAWKYVETYFRRIPRYDVEGLHNRLLLGVDRLWVAIQTSGAIQRRYLGVIVTSLTMDHPPRGFLENRTLFVHLAEGELIECWIQSAVQVIKDYARLHDSRQLFVKARKGWREYALKFYSREWDTVAYSRDRPTKAKVRWKKCNQGLYRRVVPVENMKRGLYNKSTTCYIQETHDASSS